MLLDFFIPTRCAACGDAGAELCVRCTALIATGEAIALGARGEVPPVLALGPYDGPLRAAVLSLKFKGARRVGATIGRWLAERIIWPFDRVVPVPLHAQRLRERGYNQAEMIARGIAATSRRPCVADALVRVRATVPQSGLGVGERRANVDDAFAAGARVRDVAGRAVILVDDVVTTGATVAGCAAALRSSGARAVYVACAAIRL